MQLTLRFGLLTLLTSLCLTGCGGIGYDAAGGGGTADESPAPGAPLAPTISLPATMTVGAATFVLGGSTQGADSVTWSLLGGPGPAVFTDTHALTAPIHVALAGVYTVRLTATGPGGTSTDTVQVTVNAPAYTLQGSLLDSDGNKAGAVQFRWSAINGTLATRTTFADGSFALAGVVVDASEIAVLVSGR